MVGAETGSEVGILLLSSTAREGSTRDQERKRETGAERSRIRKTDEDEDGDEWESVSEEKDSEDSEWEKKQSSEVRSEVWSMRR